MKLIVNADDFGLTSGVTYGIYDAMCRGVVTSTTMMVNTSATLLAAQQEAVPHWYVEQAQCTVYESDTKPACLVLTVQGVLQDENWNRVPFSGSSEYYF